MSAMQRVPKVVENLINVGAGVYVLVDCKDVEPHSRVIRRIPEHRENAVDELDESALPSVGNEVLGDADVVRIDEI